MGCGGQVLVDREFAICYTNAITNSHGAIMKLVFAVVVALTVSACSTVGGAVSGAGEDLRKAGDWIKSR